MSCARGPYENFIDAVGGTNNFGYISPYSTRASANPQYGKLSAGLLPESFSPVPDGNKSVSGNITCKDRMTCSYTADFDGQYDEQLADMDAGDKAAISGQAQENDDGTVSVETSANPAETIKEQESFIYGGNLRHFQGGKFKVADNRINVAKSKRVGPRTEHFGTELAGFRDSQLLHESFLDTKEEQDRSNSLSLVILTVCLFFITLAVIWTTFGKCNREKAASVPTQGGYRLTGGGCCKPVNKSISSSSGKLTGSIF